MNTDTSNIFSPMVNVVGQQQRSHKRVQTVLESSHALLIENGLLEFSTTKVAAHAKLGRPSLFRYWSNSTDLFECVVACLVASGKDLTEKERVLVEYHAAYCIDKPISQFERYKRMYLEQLELMDF